MKTIVYTTATCPYCKMLKKYLDEKGIKYAEKLVDQDDMAREEMSKVSGGFMGVPFTVVTKEDGGQETIVGFDKKKVNNVYNL